MAGVIVVLKLYKFSRGTECIGGGNPAGLLLEMVVADNPATEGARQEQATKTCVPSPVRARTGALCPGHNRDSLSLPAFFLSERFHSPSSFNSPRNNYGDDLQTNL